MWFDGDMSRVALITPDAAEWTFGEVWSAVAAMARQLHGVEPGVRVGLPLANDVDSVVLFLAIQERGAIPIILDPRSTHGSWMELMSLADAELLILPATLAERASR